ncbi:hypothetical protein PHYPSEUDO_014315 [Phytophthora pseudosyringae]|uniref:SAP domain-containing protein n=1 Tax=Phytophthora pseudosyringae TaxID=221518 RepID=A0A8T1WK23_9STRA|nr:hypothetical protein PHYPSEUDO_014315 [Phytophthora pseudosyringae]
MADRVESVDERALHRELQELAKKREALDTPKSRGSAAAAGAGAGRRSVFARLGVEPTRSGGAGRQVVQLKENNARGNASWRLGKRDNEDNRQSSAVKRQRLHSAVARPEGAHRAEGRAESSKTSTTAASPSANSARAQERKLRAVAPYAQKEGIARSRRMFGALMGHLGKAKRQIEKDTDLFKRQDTKQQEAEQREKIQSQNLENQARHEAEVARVEALMVRTELDRSEQIARAKLEHLQMVRKSERQSKFLVTIASPPIYYLPAKHTKETNELVAASMEAHEAKMKANERTQEEKLRKFEAEFATKLEQLREELEAAKKGEKVKTAGEQASRATSNDAMEGDDEDMDQVHKEREEGEKMGQENAGKDPSGSPKQLTMEIEDEDVVQDSVSGSEVDGNSAADSSRSDDGEKGGKSTVRPDSKSGNQDEKGTSPRNTSNCASAAYSDTGVSSPGRVKTQRGKVKEGSETPRPKESDKAGVQKENEEAAPASQPDVAADGDSDSHVKQENDGAESATPVEPKKDPAAHVGKMKVTELRAELKKRGLDTKGLKAKLVQRLKQAIHNDDGSE